MAEEKQEIINFKMVRAKKDGLTFSYEATGGFLTQIWEYINKAMACAMHDGFQRKEPVTELEISLRFKVNGRDVNVHDIMMKYKDLDIRGFNMETIAKKILQELGYSGFIFDEQHKK